MRIQKESRAQVIIFGIFAALLMSWFVYSGKTGSRMFSNDDKKQEWNSSDPGYHK